MMNLKNRFLNFKKLSKKEKFLTVGKYGVLIVYVVCLLVLCIEALMPGSVSSGQSSGVGNIVDIPVDKAIEPTSMSLVCPSGNLPHDVKVGDSFSIIPVFEPENATYTQVTWSVDDESVVAVAYDTVTFLRAGKANITATSKYDDKISATASFDVTEVEAQSVSIKVTGENGEKLDCDPLRMVVGQSFDLSVVVLPENTTIKEYSLSADSQNIRIENGKVIALEVGVAELTATCGNASQKISIVIDEVHIDELRFNVASLILEKGKVSDTVALEIVADDEIVNPNIVWDVSDKLKLDFVSALSFKVTGEELCKVTLTASAGGKSASLDVEVIGVKATDLDCKLFVDGNETDEIYVGDKVQVVALTTPKNADSADITVSCEGLEIQNGYFIADKAGTYAMLLSHRDVSKTITLTVLDIEVSQLVIPNAPATPLELLVGEYFSLDFDFVTPSGRKPLDKRITLEATGGGRLIIDGYRIQGAGVGDVTLVCTHAASGKNAVFSITVVDRPVLSVTDIAVYANGEPLETALQMKTGENAILTFEAVGAETTVSYSVRGEAAHAIAKGGTIELIADKCGSATLELSCGQVVKSIEIEVADIEATAIVFGGESTAALGDAFDILATPVGENGLLPTDRTLHYDFDSNVIRFDGEKFIAIGMGKTAITAKCGGATAVFYLEIKDNISGISAADVQMFIGQQKSIGAKPTTVNGSEPSAYEFTFAVENSDVVKANKYGVLTALKEGTTRVTISIPALNLQKSIEISVTHLVIDTISVSLPDSIHVGKTYKLSAAVKPLKATDKRIIWSVDDQTLASINSAGELKVKKSGTFTVIASAQRGTAETRISVTAHNLLLLRKVTGYGFLTLGNFENGTATASLKQNSSARIVLQYAPDTTYKKFRLISSSDVLSVNGSTVTAVRSGEAKLTIEYWDGDENNEKQVFSVLVTVEKQKLSDVISDWGRAVRKGLGHFAAFLITGIFAALTFMFFIKRKTIAAPVTLLSGFLLAGLTELLQMIPPDRGPSFADVLLDFEGFCFSAVPIVIGFVIAATIKFFKNMKAKK